MDSMPRLVPGGPPLSPISAAARALELPAGEALKAADENLQQGLQGIRAGVSRFQGDIAQARQMIAGEHVVDRLQAEGRHLMDIAQQQGAGTAVKEAAKEGVNFIVADEMRANRLERGLMGLMKTVSAILFGVGFYFKTQVFTALILGPGAAAYALAKGKGAKEAVKIYFEVGFAPSKVLAGVVKSAVLDFEAMIKGTPSPKDLKAKYEALTESMDAVSQLKQKEEWEGRLERATVGVSKGFLALASSGPYAIAQLVYGVVGSAIAVGAWAIGKDTSYGKGIAAAPSIWAGALLTSIKNDVMVAAGQAK